VAPDTNAAVALHTTDINTTPDKNAATVWEVRGKMRWVVSGIND